MTTAGELSIRLRIDATEFERGLQRATTEAQTSARRIAQAFDAVGKRMGALGGEFSAKLTAPIALLGGAILKMTADFEAAMNVVGVLTRELGATEAQVSALAKRAKELGATTQFSATEVAEAMQFMSMAGMNAENTLGGIEAVLQIAAAGGMDMARAADIVTNVMSSQGQTAEELANSVNVLTKAFTSANTDLSQLGHAFRFAGLVSKTAGISFEQATAALAMMGNAGIQSTMAGRSLRMAMLRLVDPPKDAARALRDLGVAATNSDGTLRPLADILEELTTRGASLPQLASIFGTEAFSAMSSLIEQGPENLRKFTEQLENVGNVAQNVTEARMKGLAGAIKEMNSAFEGMAIAFGEAGVSEAVAGFFKDMRDWFAAVSVLNPELLRTIAIVAGLVAGIGPLLIVLGTLVWSIGQLALGVAALVGFLSGPVGLAVAIGAIVLALASWAQGLSEVGRLQKALNQTVTGANSLAAEYETATLDRAEAIEKERAALVGLMRQRVASARQKLAEAERNQRLAAMRPSGGAFESLAIGKMRKALAAAEAELAEADARWAAAQSARGRMMAEAMGQARPARAEVGPASIAPSLYAQKTKEAAEAVREQIAEMQRLAVAAGQGEQALRRMEVTNALLGQGFEIGDRRLAGFVDQIIAAQDALSYLQGQTEKTKRSQEALNNLFGQNGEIESLERLTAAMGGGEESTSREQIRQQLVRSGVDATADSMKRLVDVIYSAQEAYRKAGEAAAFWSSLGAAPIDAIKAGLSDGEFSLGSAVRDFGERFRQILLEEFAFKPLDELAKELARGLKEAFSGAAQAFSEAIGGGGIWRALGSAVGSLFGRLPGRAIGGSTLPGKPYLVGEQGPELFIPSGLGRIEPLRNVGGGGGMGGAGGMVFAPVINANGLSLAEANQLVRQSEARMMGRYDEMWRRSQRSYVRHGGELRERRR